MYFVVGYDIREENDDSEIREAIEKYLGFRHILFSQYVIEVNDYKDAKSLLKHFQGYVEPDDSICVAQIADEDCVWVNRYDELEDS
jgi:CRISPR-associated endonuclease Cas2